MRGSIKLTGKAKTRAGRAAQILAKRVVFRWLPVVFSNDLIHGSWSVSNYHSLYVVVALLLSHTTTPDGSTLHVYMILQLR